MRADRVDAVLRFWFEELGPEQWFNGGEAVDQAVRERFLGDVEALAAAPADALGADPRVALAAVLVLDQLPRNAFRGTARAFATDAAARAVCREAMRHGIDRELTERERGFLYLPLMHSEELADQDLAVALFRHLDGGASLPWAERHREVIARFGRFPHRNAALGREDTAEERAFLADAERWGQ